MLEPESSFNERDKGPSYRGLEGKKQTKATRDTGVDDLHWGNLWDENEDQAGQQTDEATGKAIDNSTFTDEGIVLRSGGYVVELDSTGEEPVLEPWEEHEKAADELADAWLEERAAQLAAEDQSHDQVA